MKLEVHGVSKKFNNQWIFRDLNFKIDSKTELAITGSNGSGKTTLLKILSAYSEPSRGEVTYLSNKGESISPDNVPTRFNYCAPYVNLIEEFTLFEHLEFNSKFKSPKFPIAEMIERIGLIASKNKRVSEFSSGMKQRLKLAIAFFFNSEVTFFDEPTTNLDEDGIDLYLREIQFLIGQSTIIIASNQPFEYELIDNVMSLSDEQI